MQFDTQALYLFAIVIPNLILGLFILTRNVKDNINRYFASFAIGVATWSFGLGMYVSTTETNTAILFAGLYYIAAASIATSFALFCYYFSLQKVAIRSSRYLLVVSPFIVIAILTILYPKWLITGITYHEWGKEVVLNKLGYLIYSLYFVGYVLYGFIAIIRKMLHAQGKFRTNLRLIFLGLILAFSLGMTFNLIYPALGNYKYIWVGPQFTFIYVLITFYAIVKHRLFDMRAVVARSVAYLLAIVIAVFVYSVFVLMINNTFFGSSVLPTSQKIFYIFTAVVLAFTFQPLKRSFDKLTKNVFYKDAYDAQTFIDQLNQAIVSDIHLESLLKKCANVIVDNIKVEFCSFGLKQTENLPQQIIGSYKKEFLQNDIDRVRGLTLNFGKKIIITDDLDADSSDLKSILSNYDIGALVRLNTDIVSNKEGVGYIVLGYKKSGSPFNATDNRVLEIIANEMVIAIQNSMQFEEIQAFNLTLQEKVKEATHELKRTNKKLIALDDAKDEFISMASHQLRTPLTSIKGYLSMMLEGDLGKISAQQQKALKEAFGSSQRMVFLIADFLNVSRIKTGKFIIEARAVDLPQIVEEEITQLREMASSREVSLLYEPPGSFPQVKLDDNKIRQVMMNMVDNAIYYTPQGGDVQIQLYVSGQEVVFKVIDSGIGVPKREQHKLFTKFFRAANARKARPDGTGLGLFMAQKIIVEQGGAVIFESTENKGSTFGFRFPLNKVKV